MSATSSEKSAAATRGRSAASKPLNASNKVASSNKPSRPPSTSSIASSKSSASGAPSSSVRAGKAASTSRAPLESDNDFKVTKLSSTTVTLQTTWTPKPASAPTQPSAAPESQIRGADPLQIAAQVYPWTYMTSTLDACFKGAEAAATADLTSRASQLSAEESEIADQRARLEAERSIKFFDELGSDPFAKEAPAIMQSFHSHGDACTRIETEALKLAMRGVSEEPEDEPLKVYQDMLHQLEELQDEATILQDSIVKLTQTSPVPDNAEGEDKDSTPEDVSSARSQVNGVFAACLPVLRARIANLSMAQELVDSALENVSLGLRMESMGLTD